MNMNLKISTTVACLLLSAVATMAQENLSVRVRENFDEGWQFHKEGDDNWQDISIPHDWAVEQDPVKSDSENAVNHGFKLGGKGYYRKTFSIDKADEGKKISLEFDGIFRNSSVWVNGRYLGTFASGYVPSNYDITDVLNYGDEGENELLVNVDATETEGWFYEGAGIYRHVWLNKTDRLHVDRFGTFVTTPTITDEKAEVSIQIDVRNDYAKDMAYEVVSDITDASGKVIATVKDNAKVESISTGQITQHTSIENPSLWSPETPVMYRVYTKIIADGKVVDDYVTPFGVRYFEFTREGFFLNGKPCYIKGTCNHQDFAGVGAAMPDKLHEYRVGLLKEMGSNAYRMSHNAPTPELLDICDRMGMLVMDENRTYSSSEVGLSYLTTMVKRDRNHPSIFIWCIENEERPEGTPLGVRITTTMHDVLRKLDPTRPTTGGMNHGWNDNGYGEIYEVCGYNYGQRGRQYFKDYENYPNRLMIGTESTSFISTRGEYADDSTKLYVSNVGTTVGWGDFPGNDWRDVVENPALSGTFVWTGFDYRGEPTPYPVWPSVSSHFGIFDLCGFPKDGYYAYKAMWRDEPLVHAFPSWNLPGKEGETIKMWVYTNCEEYEIRINGKSLGRRKAEPYVHNEIEAVYQPGKMEIRGYNGGKLVTKEVNETSGPAKNVTLSANTTTLEANGTDVMVVNVAIRDAKGRVSQLADNLVKFTVDGPAKIIGVGNGNPTSHESEKEPQRKAFHGLCQVLIQTTKEAGVITLHAESDGLKPAVISAVSK